MPSHDPSRRRSTARLRRELKRKSLHLLLLSVPLIGVVIPGLWGRLGLILATCLLILGDWVRLRNRRVRGFVLRRFGRLFRGDEFDHLLGSTYYVASAMICVLVFDRWIAISALLFLVLGDAAAAIAGRRFGRTKLWGKSLEGSAACFVVCFAVGCFALDHWWVAAGGALAATIAEVVPLPVNDNFRIPLLSALAMHFLTFHI